MVFFTLALVWYWPLINQLIRPTLVEVGVVEIEAPIDNGIVYERLGISSPLSVDSGTSPLAEQDWAKIAGSLRSGVSLAFEQDSFEDSKLSFLTGHSSDVERHAFASIFAPLGQAKIGDTFELFINEENYQYTVSVTKIISPASIEEFEQLEDDGQRVALVTCWPPLTTTNRMVVVGDLVN